MRVDPDWTGRWMCSQSAGRRVDRLDDVAMKVVGMGGGEPDAADSVNRRDFAEQFGELQIAWRRIAIRIHCLAEQLNFGIACFNQSTGFGENGIAGTAAFGSARVRHDAIGAGVVAAFDDGEVRTQRIVAAGDFGFEGLVGVQIEAGDATAAGFNLIEELRELAVTG